MRPYGGEDLSRGSRPIASRNGGQAPYKGSIQSAIQATVDSYSPSMRRIADAILARPQIMLENTITELAHACDTSETSVVRFCRTLGFAGFAPMKLQLAIELATESAQFGFGAEHGSDIRPTGTRAEMVWKVASAETLGIQEPPRRSTSRAQGRYEMSVEALKNTYAQPRST